MRQGSRFTAEEGDFEGAMPPGAQRYQLGLRAQFRRARRELKFFESEVVIREPGVVIRDS